MAENSWNWLKTFAHYIFHDTLVSYEAYVGVMLFVLPQMCLEYAQNKFCILVAY